MNIDIECIKSTSRNSSHYDPSEGARVFDITPQARSHVVSGDSDGCSVVWKIFDIPILVLEGYNVSSIG